MGRLTIKERDTIEKVIRDAKNGSPYALNSAPRGHMTKEEAKVLEEDLKKRFEAFAQSWIITPLENLLENAKPRGDQ